MEWWPETNIKSCSCSTLCVGNQFELNLEINCGFNNVSQHELEHFLCCNIYQKCRDPKRRDPKCRDQKSLRSARRHDENLSGTIMMTISNETSNPAAAGQARPCQAFRARPRRAHRAHARQFVLLFSHRTRPMIAAPSNPQPTRLRWRLKSLQPAAIPEGKFSTFRRVDAAAWMPTKTATSISTEKYSWGRAGSSRS